MIGLKEKKYLSVSKKRFDPVTVFFSIGLLAAVLVTAIGFDTGETNSLMFNDFRSFFFVVGGTLGVLLFQFDLETFLHTFLLVARSFIANPVKHLNPAIEELDEAIIKGSSILELREATEIQGELLNDIVYMVKEKLFFEEIEDFVSNRVASLFLVRKVAVSLLNKGAKIATCLQGPLQYIVGAPVWRPLLEGLCGISRSGKGLPAASCCYRKLFGLTGDWRYQVPLMATNFLPSSARSRTTNSWRP